MSMIVFLGPSLPVDDARVCLDAVYLPPVSQGDVYRVCAHQPDAIGIVDGRFQDVPAVWHKEILWALTQGIPVYGCSSMGALRAAELDLFGMRGVGRIYRAYRDGELEDDDEVAVAHLSADEGYAPISEPMVDIRATLEKAARTEVIDAAMAADLIRRAKKLFYPQRSYQAVLADAKCAGVRADDLSEFSAWLKTHRVRQKQDDALEMLSLMAAGVVPPEVSFTFEHTQFFERARRSAGAVVVREHNVNAGGSPRDSCPGSLTLEALLDELRLQPELYWTIRQRALTRCLVARDAARNRVSSTSRDLQSAVDRFRRIRNLARPEDTEVWMNANHLNLRQLAALAMEDAAITDRSIELEGELDIYLRNELRSSGEYATLAVRAHDKHRVLTSLGVADASVDEIDDANVLAWFFDRSGQDAPADLDGFMQALGYTDPVVFLRALKREFWYTTRTCAPISSTSRA